MHTARRYRVLTVSLAFACGWPALSAYAGSLWKVVTVEGKPASGATFEISAGRIAGNGGCNTYSAPAKFVRGRVEIGPVAATRMACDRLESEQAFFSALERARKFSVDGQTMKLGDEDGKTLIVLSR